MIWAICQNHQSSQHDTTGKLAHHRIDPRARELSQQIICGLQSKCKSPGDSADVREHLPCVLLAERQTLQCLCSLRGMKQDWESRLAAVDELKELEKAALCASCCCWAMSQVT